MVISEDKLTRKQRIIREFRESFPKFFPGLSNVKGFNRIEYQRYLASPEWAVLRKRVGERCSDRCERCHVGTYANAHHLTYDRLYHESLEDLQGLCHDCHIFIHGRSKFDPLSAGKIFNLGYNLGLIHDSKFVLGSLVVCPLCRAQDRGERLVVEIADPSNSEGLKIGSVHLLFGHMRVLEKEAGYQLVIPVRCDLRHTFDLVLVNDHGKAYLEHRNLEVGL